MGLGFKLGVDYSAATNAKRELAELNKSMGSLGQSKTIDFGAGLEGASEALKEINEHVKHLNSLAKTGERQKGFLRVDQFKEASRVSKEIKGTFDSYYKSLSSAENQLDRLISKRRKLITLREEAKGFTTKREIAEDIKSVSGEIKSLTKELDKRFTIERRLGRKAEGASGRIGGMQQAGGGLGGMLGGGMKKAGMIGLGLAGGFSIYNFIKDSIAKEIEFASVESNLLMRGGSVKRKGSYGYTPLQAAQQADIINKATGLGGEELNKVVKNIKMFARGRGASGGRVGEYAAGVYQTTGFGYKQFEKLFKELTFSIKEGKVGGRVEEFLQTNRQIITQLSQGVGGAQLSPKTLSVITDFQTRLWKQGEIGRGASGAGLMSSIDQGIRGGGKTPGQQMFMLNALTGGEGVKNFSEYYDYIGLREQGMWGIGKTGKTNVEAMLERSTKRFGTDESGQIKDIGRFNIKAMWNLTNKQVDLLAKMYSEGGFKDLGKAKEAVEGIDLKKDADKFMLTTGGKHLGVISEIDTLKLKIGKDLVPSIDNLKNRLISVEKKLERFIDPNGDRARQIYGQGLELTPQQELEERGRMFNVMGGGYAVKRELEARIKDRGGKEEEQPLMIGLDDIINQDGRIRRATTFPAGSFEEGLNQDNANAIRIAIDLAPDVKRILEAKVMNMGSEYE